MSDGFEMQVRSVATVRDVARMVALSPSRFYQLQQAGIFPPPLYDIATRRPFYNEEQQRACLEVRRRNCGINGKPVLFYARRLDGVAVKSSSRRNVLKKTNSREHDEIIAGLKSLGLTGITTQAVQEAVRKSFPGGTTKVDPAEVIRNVFLRLKHQDRGDSVGR